MKRTGTQVLSKIHVFLRMIPNFAVHCHNLVQLTCYQTATCSYSWAWLPYLLTSLSARWRVVVSIVSTMAVAVVKWTVIIIVARNKRFIVVLLLLLFLLLHRRWTTVLIIIINERIMVVAATLTRPSSMVTGISTTIGLVTTMMLDTGQMGGIELI